MIGKIFYNSSNNELRITAINKTALSYEYVNEDNTGTLTLDYFYRKINERFYKWKYNDPIVKSMLEILK